MSSQQVRKNAKQQLSQTPRAIARRKARQEARASKKNGVQSNQSKQKKKLKMPRRTWRNAGQGQVVVKDDARFATQAATDFSLSTQLKSITIDKALDSTSTAWVARGFLSRAFERGFAGAASSEQVPYYALVYLTNLFLDYANASNVPVTQLPLWVLQLCHAYSPKTVDFEHGKTSYKFTVGETLPVTPSVSALIGYLAYGYFWTCGWNTGTTINGFPTVETTPVGYTDQLGQSAFQELCQFMESNTTKLKMKRLTTLIPSSVQTPFAKDPSTFALMSKAEGLGSSGFGGGITGQLQLEVEPPTPLLTLASCGNDTLDVAPPTRFFNKSMPVAGDPLFLGAAMSTMFTEKQFKTPHVMRFKPIDFLQFGDVLAQWVAGIQQAYLTSVTQAQTKTVATATVQCPLTLQEMLLCLRNTMMGAFKETIASSQGIYPFTPGSGTDNQFVPFVSSGNTCPIEILDMQLPTPLIENIRALAGRRIPSAEGFYWYCPVLGQYATDLLNTSDYVVTYTGSDGVVTANAFPTTSFFRETEITAKGESKSRMLVETPISMVDGSASTSLCAINDPSQLKTLLVLWNDWLKTTGVGSFSVQLGTVGTEKGISILCSIASSRVWIASASLRQRTSGPLRERRDSRKSLSKIADVRFEAPRFRGILTSVYASRQAIATTHQCEVLAAPFEEVLDTWILPIVNDEFIVGSNSSALQRWQFIMGEPHAANSSSGENGTLLSTINSSYASKMVKSNLAQADDWTEFFNTVAKLGRGGILTGLLAGLVGKAFPAVGGIASTIADALPL